MVNMEKIYLKRSADDAILTYRQYFKDKTYRIVLSDTINFNFELSEEDFKKFINIDDNFNRIPNAKTINRFVSFVGIKHLFNPKANAFIFHDYEENKDNLAVLINNINHDKKSLAIIVFDIIGSELKLSDIDYKTKAGGKNLTSNKYIYILRNIDKYHSYIIAELKNKQKSII